MNTTDGTQDSRARRIDFFDDPAAPVANSLVPSANVVVVNDAGELLLIHRTDNDNWALPGGAMDLGESLVDTAVRETREETGIACEVTGLVGIYTDPRHVILYTSNDEARQEFSVVFTARPLAGTPTPSSETREVVWMDPGAVGALPMDRSMRTRIGHYLDRRPVPYLG
jgi:ADP-ribose pyrophosphatase YjhB (NUDIX family)